MISKHTLWEQAEKLGIRIDYFAETTSTNDVARSPQYGHGDMVVAQTQTKGRGQRGNLWESESGQNLTFSLVLEPRFLSAECQFLLSETVSLSVTDMLEGYGIGAQIKWPNDIYLDGLKMGGILIENDICSSNLSRSIVGIGLNVNQTEFGEGVPNPVSMSLALGRDFDRNEVLSGFYSVFTARYAALANGCVDALENDYHKRLYLLDTPHRYRLPDGSHFTGTIRHVKSTGELIVEHENGVLKGYLFKEIEF